jgi:pimeloyl-ACP methyl ester carboxylesterase
MAALRTMIGLSKSDTEAMLPSIRVPALVVMGTLDPDFPDAKAEAAWLASAFGAQSLIIEGAGHYPQTEMPEQVAPALIAFIKNLK